MYLDKIFIIISKSAYQFWNKKIAYSLFSGAISPIAQCPITLKGLNAVNLFKQLKVYLRSEQHSGNITITGGITRKLSCYFILQTQIVHLSRPSKLNKIEIIYNIYLESKSHQPYGWFSSGSVLYPGELNWNLECAFL